MFYSAHEALVWAYSEYARPVIDLSSVNDMRGNSPSTRNDLLIGLSPKERHDQAVQIIGIADHLPDRANGQYLGAKFGYRIEHDDVKVLMHRLLAMLGTGVHNRRAVQQSLRMYFGAKVTQDAVRRLLACSNAAAVTFKQKVFDRLDIIHARSMAEITPCLEHKGIVLMAEYA